MTAEELLRSLENNPMERLRWRVLTKFGILPASRRGKELSDEEILICGAHMVLDAGAVPGRYGGAETGKNSSFDEDRYLRLAGGVYE